MTTIDERLGAIIGELIDAGITLSQAIDAFERKCIAVALKRSGGNLSRAATALCVHRNTLHNKLRDRDVDVPRRRQRRRPRGGRA